MTGNSQNYEMINSVPAGWAYDGVCQFVGLFEIGGTIYSEVNNQVCGFSTWPLFVSLTGRTSSAGIPVVDAFPSGAAYIGICTANVVGEFAHAYQGIGAGHWVGGSRGPVTQTEQVSLVSGPELANSIESQMGSQE
jgi:hypothetical protein